MVYGGFSLLVNSCLFIKAIQCQIMEGNLQPFSNIGFPIKLLLFLLVMVRWVELFNVMHCLKLKVLGVNKMED